MVLGTTHWSQTNLHGSYIRQVQHKYSLALVLAFHPNDGDILYLAIEVKVLLCKSKTVEVFCDIPHMTLTLGMISAILPLCS